jgi:hypothetical protein
LLPNDDCPNTVPEGFAGVVLEPKVVGFPANTENPPPPALEPPKALPEDDPPKAPEAGRIKDELLACPNVEDCPNAEAEAGWVG